MSTFCCRSPLITTTTASDKKDLEVPWNQHYSLSMKIRVGIVGLPNCGKSTLFNALARRSIASAANFPFCTIDPNLASIPVPDPHLDRFGRWDGGSHHITKPAVMEWIDVAGLVQGAHRGEGLGNRFLGTLRECQVLCHVIRVFEDSNIVHVNDGKVNPVEDANAVHLELLLADLEHVERRLEKKSCMGLERQALETVIQGLHQGIPARAMGLPQEAMASLKSMGLLTLKPVIYAFNVDVVDFVYREQACENVQTLVNSVQYGDSSKDLWTIVSANVEQEISMLPNDALSAYLVDLGIDGGVDSSTVDLKLCFHILPTLVQKMLNLSLVYTGPGVSTARSQTTKAHLVTLDQQVTAHDLAGRLHRDIQMGFIRAEVTPAAKLLEHSSYLAAKESGVTRVEGKEYVLQEHDVILIKWK